MTLYGSTVVNRCFRREHATGIVTGSRACPRRFRALPDCRRSETKLPRVNSLLFLRTLARLR